MQLICPSYRRKKVNEINVINKPNPHSNQILRVQHLKLKAILHGNAIVGDNSTSFGVGSEDLITHQNVEYLY
jgi:hypothetical protein